MHRRIRPNVDILEDRALLAAGFALHPDLIHAYRVTHVLHPVAHTPFRLAPPVIITPSTPSTPPPTSPGPTGDIVATIVTDKTSYRAGEPVTITVTETNVSNHVATTTYGPSQDSFSVTQGDRTVWGSNTGVMVPMFLELVTLQPGESRTFQAVWDGRPSPGNAGNPISGSPLTGNFEVSARFTGLTVAPTKITVG